jgi:hypothetical protein
MSNKPSESMAILATIDPQAAGTTTASTDAIDCRYPRFVTFLVSTGAVLATGTVDFIVREMTASTTGTTTVAGGVAAITQLVGTADSNKQVIVEVDTRKLGNRYIKGVLTTGTANGIGHVIALGSEMRYQPASDYDLASVDEIVSN